MDIKELKQYIDKVLGDSVRCLLPSHWWKKLFYKITDEIEDVVPIIDTKKQLDKENYLNGKIATVVNSNIKPSNIPYIANPGSDEQLLLKSIQFRSIEVYEGTPTANSLLWFAIQDTDGIIKLGGFIADAENKVVGAVLDIFEQVSEFKFSENGKLNKGAINNFNNLLKTVKCYLINVGGFLPSENLSNLDKFITFIGDTDLYVKSTQWQKIAKIDDLTNFSKVVVDSELSTESENPVQNKILTEELNNKVDKISGKQLSTEDFTTALKTKLESLSNYDDTEISKVTETLRSDLDNLVSGDTTQAITSFNEIIAFLEGIKDSENLDSIIASIEQQIANIPSKTSQLTNDSGFLTEHQDISHLASREELNEKQNVIPDLEIIRSGAAKGETALQEHQDLSYLATKDDVVEVEHVTSVGLTKLNQKIIHLYNDLILNYIKSETIKKEIEDIYTTIINNEEVVSFALNDLNERIIRSHNDIISRYVTNSDFNIEKGVVRNEIVNNEDVISNALNLLNEKIIRWKNKSIVDFATKTSLKSEIDVVDSIILNNEEVISNALNDLNERIIQNHNHAIATYVTKSEQKSEIKKIEELILNNEEVISNALNDLNERIESALNLIKQLQTITQ